MKADLHTDIFGPSWLIKIVYLNVKLSISTAKNINFYDYFAECKIGVSEREFTRLVSRSVTPSFHVHAMLF